MSMHWHNPQRNGAEVPYGSFVTPLGQHGICARICASQTMGKVRIVVLGHVTESSWWPPHKVGTFCPRRLFGTLSPDDSS